MKKEYLFSKKYLFAFSFLLIAFVSIRCVAKAPALRDGAYQFNLQRADGKNIVFNTRVTDSLGKKILYVINGSEKIVADSIVFKNDSVYIELPFFESGFQAKVKDNGDLEGSWIKSYGTRIQTMPFTATYNITERFPTTDKPAQDVSGRWSVNFLGRDNDTTLSVGEFVQNGSQLTGTFLLSSGDYRFLEGVVSGDSLYLSAFDGAHALLFTAKIDDANHISGGKLFSGKQGTQTWTGERNANAKLPEAASTIQVKPNAGKLNFKFRDTEGKYVSITDDRYKNKVVVIQILGSWCPNCLDETRFLTSNYKKYNDKGVEFLGIAYERTADFETSQKALAPFVKKLEIPYPVLIADVALSDSLRTEKTLPQIEKINAFPTTIFVGKNGEISKIHSGFDGPATGVHYDMYRKSFDETINEMLNAK